MGNSLNRPIPLFRGVSSVAKREVNKKVWLIDMHYDEKGSSPPPPPPLFSTPCSNCTLQKLGLFTIMQSVGQVVRNEH